ncbi:MAG: 3-hydroxyacyl-CoA dehydrogenase family protein, partial [Acinetobacter sp.]
GFIINHAGRAYGTEALKILNENVSTVEDIDRILRDGVGFKMGPFELLDLTGLDVSHPVMESIYHQYYEEPRYKPNPLTRQMLETGQLGRKTGEGFYQYTDNMKKQTAPLSEKLSSIKSQSFPMVWVGADFLQDQKILENYLSQHNILIDSADQPKPESLCILASYGEDTTHACIRYMTDPSRTIAIDMLYGFEKHRTLMPSLLASSEMIEIAQSIFSLDGRTTSTINESFGFVAQRVLAMVINLGCDIAQQKIATVDDINAAVRLGLGYPFGPIEWGDQLGAEKILLILKRISSLTADPRYRLSPWLQRRAILNLPLVFSQI